MGIRLRRVVEVVAIAVFGLVGQASAATITVGQNVSANEQCGSGLILYQTAVTSGSSYTVPSGSWAITSWSADGNVWGGQGSLVLLRPTGTPGSLDVVATSAVEPFAVGQLNTFPTSILTEGGDIVGLWGGPNGVTSPGTACAMGIPSPTDTFSFEPAGTQPVAGTTLSSFTNGAFVRVNISATLVSLPTSADDCMNGGWQSFSVFKNQGDCVSFVATGGKNLPAS